MKPLLILLVASAVLNAAPVVASLPWRDACEGATIEVTSEESRIVSVRAVAVHFAVMIEWTIHYIDGIPATAEFRESERGRVMEGDDAGSPSGTNRLKRIKTFKWQDGKFRIEDEALNKDLLEILAALPK